MAELLGPVVAALIGVAFSIIGYGVGLLRGLVHQQTAQSTAILLLAERIDANIPSNVRNELGGDDD